MLKININTTNLEKINKSLSEVEERVNDLKDVAPGIYEMLSEDVLHRFETAPLCETGGEVFGGENWRRLKDSTLKQRPDRMGQKIMTDKGRLRQSFQLTSPENYARTYNKNIQFGSNVPYAKKQNSMRKLLFLHPDLMSKITSYLLTYAILGKEGIDDYKYKK